MAEKLHRLALAFLATFVLIGTAQAESVRLTILHTNDTHGHLLPFSYPETVEPRSDVASLSARQNIGGMARISTLANQIKQSVRESGGTAWLVDVGDFCDGTPFSTEYKGSADNAAMNAAGYDFGTFGNHEFNNTLEQVQRLIAGSKRALVACNARLKDSGKPLLEPFRIVRVGGARVAVTGVITTSSGTYPAAREGVEFEDEVQAVRRTVGELRGKADVVVLLSHAGYEVDLRIARQVPGVDVIVGGHSHTRLPYGFVQFFGEDLFQDRVNGTIIVQAFQWGGELGRLDLLLSKTRRGWAVSRHRARLLAIDASIPEDPEVKSVVERFWRPIAAKYGEVVGQALADIAPRYDDLAEYNLVADAVRETLGVQFDLENISGVRAPLIKGPITMGDLVAVDPFNNTVVKTRLTGAQLKAVLLRHRPAVSGIRYRIERGRLVEASVAGEPIRDDQVYEGAANSYFANYALREYGYEDTGRGRLAVLVEYIRKKQNLLPSYDGRRVIIN
ncbi:MAG: bifunctional metallophosphatase/5'-nucleotidase [Fimbriimonadales bacterium]|nr:bifunctional metallophosphatase/5'-nucleotidase [Fimbriimonadales bacterium]